MCHPFFSLFHISFVFVQHLFSFFVVEVAIGTYGWFDKKFIVYECEAHFSIPSVPKDLFIHFMCECVYMNKRDDDCWEVKETEI